jgi:hypothetical protein
MVSQRKSSKTPSREFLSHPLARGSSAYCTSIFTRQAEVFFAQDMKKKMFLECDEISIKGYAHQSPFVILALDL